MLDWIRQKIAQFLLPDKQFFVVGGVFHSVLHPIMKGIVKRKIDG